MEGYYDSDGMDIYMYLPDITLDCDNYEVHMLGNKIEYIAEMEIRSINGVCIPYYNVSGLVEYKSMFGSTDMEPEVIMLLVGNILSALTECSSYLLTVNNLLLDERFIYYSTENKRFSFIYVPGYNKNVRKQIKSLLENAMKYMNHKNEEEANYIYDLYEKCSGDNYDIKALMPDMNMHLNDSRNNPPEEEIIEEEYINEDKETDTFINKDEFKQKKSMRIYKIFLLISMGVTCCLGLINLYMQYKKLGQISDLSSLIGVLIFFVVEIFVYFEIGKYKADMSSSEEFEMEDAEDSQDTYMQADVYSDNNTSQANTYVYHNTYVLMPYGANHNSPIYINQQYVLIGRENKSDYCLKNDSISRKHAQIYNYNNQLIIEDLNSTNGTYVNNYPIKAGYPAVIFSGDIVRFGNQEYRILNV